VKSAQIRQKFLDFFEAKGHTIVPSFSLVPDNDPTTLFTSSGMQPMVPYLLGQEHPLGRRIVDSQRCFRAVDIEEVGDSRHTTFFEMLGNWSFGDYFKKEQLTWLYEFLTKELQIDSDKLYVTCFGGDNQFKLPKDTESYAIWKELGVPEERISFYGGEKNWWNRGKTGPATTPIGDPCGPDSEVFYEFSDIAHNPKFGEECHVNCDCGRYVEIANSVFMEYLKQDETTFVPLAQKNVDFGGGLERIAMAVNNEADIFKAVEVLEAIIKELERLGANASVDYLANNFPLRIIADHIRAAVFMIQDGIVPSNKEAGYVLRRLIRRSALQLHQLQIKDLVVWKNLVGIIAEHYGDLYPELISNRNGNLEILLAEVNKFNETLEKGLKEITKVEQLDGKLAFKLYETYGFPFELTEEIARERGQAVEYGVFRAEFKKHQTLSRQNSKSKFGGHGLILDTGELKAGDEIELKKATRLHTATHLLQASLRKVLGENIQQRGSDINADRLRFDFSFERKLTDEEKERVEMNVNHFIKEGLKVTKQEMSYDEAIKSGALAFFKQKYPERVTVYTIATNSGEIISKELCGGPHIDNSSKLGSFEIKKEESVGAGVRRIKAVLQ